MPTTSRSSSAIFRSVLRLSTARQTALFEGGVGFAPAPPDRVDRLEPLERRVDDLELRGVVERDGRARPPLARAQLVEHAVLRHLEEPRRELRAQRELRESLEDAEEDLLRQILSQ